MAQEHSHSNSRPVERVDSLQMAQTAPTATQLEQQASQQQSPPLSHGLDAPAGTTEGAIETPSTSGDKSSAGIALTAPASSSSSASRIDAYTTLISPTQYKPCRSPEMGPISRISTAVSTPEQPQQQPSHPVVLAQTCRADECLLKMLARLVAFTDVFLAGLVIPLIPFLLESRSHVPQGQLQIWTAVLVSAYGGASAVISPLVSHLPQKGLWPFAVLFAGLVCAAAALRVFQSYSDVCSLIFARALQGISAAALTAAVSGIIAKVACAAGRQATPLSPAVTQNMAMTIAPAAAGLLHDYYNVNVVFQLAYGLVGANALLTLIAALANQSHQPTEGPDSCPVEPQARGYGTIHSGFPRSGSSPISSRSISPASFPLSFPPRSSHREPSTFHSNVTWSHRVLVAFFGYLVIGLLTSALQSVLPLFVQRQFKWPVSAAGLIFVPLSAPAALIGPLSGALVARIPTSARYLTAFGFTASIPAFVYLGQLDGSTKLKLHAFIMTLTGLSSAIALAGDPLIEELTNALNASGSTTTHVTTLPNLAASWGSFVGPLFAGAVTSLWGWAIMNRSLALVSAAAGLVSLFFLQGWIRSPAPEVRSHRTESSSDEESAPLLASERSGNAVFSKLAAHKQEGADCSRRSDSESSSPHTQKRRKHRRHFSVDNFSLTTSAGPGSIDSTTSSVRFQASLETPIPSLPRCTHSCDSKKPAAAPERRYVLREAAEEETTTTDPLLAEGSLYVIDEERDPAASTVKADSEAKKNKKKRKVAVFEEGTAPPELLARHRHHVVAINAIDGTAQMVEGADAQSVGHSVCVTENLSQNDDEEEELEQTATVRRYVVVIIEEDEAETGKAEERR